MNHKNSVQLSREGKWMTMKKNAVPYLLLAPVIIFVCLFMLWPILNVFKMSVENYMVTRPAQRHFIGLDNFKEIFTDDPVFYRALGTTAIYVLVSVAIQTVLGFWLAWLLTRKFKGLNSIIKYAVLKEDIYGF